jgi:hypothetical protein
MNFENQMYFADWCAPGKHGNDQVLFRCICFNWRSVNKNVSHKAICFLFWLLISGSGSYIYRKFVQALVYNKYYTE